MNAKQQAAERAVDYVRDGMTIGLGTGSTAAFAIEAIGEKVKQGLSIKAVASSLKSEDQAVAAGIKLVSFTGLTSLDLYIDGADEVDPGFNLIKGGGGALLREKILAFNSEQFVVIVDDSKRVPKLGAFPLPVEVTPYALELTMLHLQNLDCVPNLRQREGKAFVTDNGNVIVDCAFKEIRDVPALSRSIKEIPGVVETGLFSKELVSTVIVGHANRDAEVLRVK